MVRIIVCSPARLNHTKCAGYSSTLEYSTVARMDSSRRVESVRTSTGNHVRTALRSSSPTYLPAHAERVFDIRQAPYQKA
jgi:hypothetical protein